jgi:uncharacterized membrane protein
LWCLVHKKQSVINCDDEFLENKTFSFSKQNRGLNQQEKMPCIYAHRPRWLISYFGLCLSIVSLPFVVWFGCSLIGSLNLDPSMMLCILLKQKQYNWSLVGSVVIDAKFSRETMVGPPQLRSGGDWNHLIAELIPN